MQIAEIRSTANKALLASRAIIDAATSGVLGAEDQARYDALWTEYEGAKASLIRAEKLETEERWAAEPATPPTKPVPSSDGDGQRTTKGTDPDLFRRYLQFGVQGLRSGEERALQMDSDTGGGYLVAPEQFMARLIKGVDNVVHIRGRATVYPVTNAASLGFPSLAADPDDFDWTVELGTGSEDSTMAFGKREFKPNPLAKRIKVSNRLLRVSSLDPETLVIQRLAYKLGITQEKAFLTGHGAGQPLGVFVASNDGVDTSRDTTCASQTAFTADELQDVKFALKPQYRLAAAWLLHRDAVKRAAKLKDGNGQYLLQPGISADIPDRILGLPFMESEYAPNTFTTQKYVAILADWSWYWIADALDMQVQRLVELYAETNQAGFIARYEGDGMPVLAEAFSRLILA